MSIQRALVDILAELEQAKTDLAFADNKLSDVRAEHTAALNKVNRLQKEFDAVVDEMKKSAPRDSDWKRKPFMVTTSQGC